MPVGSGWPGRIMPDPFVLGAILAGGKSRRFGSSKVLAPFLGEPMVRRVARALDPVCHRLVVVGRAEELAGHVDHPILPDVVADAGPLGGLHAALLAARDSGARAVLLVGCDMPLLTSGILASVRAEGEKCGRPASVPGGGPGSGGVPHRHPICGWYSVECLDAVEERLDGDDLSLHSLLTALDAHRISPDRLGPSATAALRSANTPEELEELEVIALEGADADLPPTVCVVGWKDSGKTGVAVALIAELRRRGHRVAAVKHGHHFRLDTPGTDSWRLRHEGGADPVLLAGPETFALMGGWDAAGEPGLAGLLRRFPATAEPDVVVAEGFKRAPFPRIEVFREAAGAEEPIFLSGGPQPGRLLALVTDRRGGTGSVGTVIELNEPGLPHRLADLVEREVMGRAVGGIRDPL